jgi:hypothetical protein
MADAAALPGQLQAAEIRVTYAMTGSAVLVAVLARLLGRAKRARTRDLHHTESLSMLAGQHWFLVVHLKLAAREQVPMIN